MQIELQNIPKRIIWIRYLTFRRVMNFLGLQASYFLSIFGIHFIRGLSPFFISVEPCNYCQLNCPECPVGNATQLPVKETAMDYGTFQTLINEMEATLLHVILYFQGEPLINKNFTNFAKYAHEKNIFTSTSTNAQLLNNLLAKEIVQSGLDKIIISIDGTTQEVYQQYRVGGKLQKAIDGIQHLVAWKKELKSGTPFIEIQFIVLKTNEHQLSEMKALSKNLGADKLTFKTAQLYDFENGHSLMPINSKYSRYKKGTDGIFYIKAKQPNHCWRLWNGAVVSADARVIPCCFDKDGMNAYGKLDANTFHGIWQNKTASTFRESILKNRKQYEMCRNCTSK